MAKQKAKATYALATLLWLDASRRTARTADLVDQSLVIGSIYAVAVTPLLSKIRTAWTTAVSD